MSERWWCTEGELLWANENWRLRFLWDDGTLWGLSLVPRESVDTAPNLHWDYKLGSIEGSYPSGMAQEEKAAVHSAVARSSPVPIRDTFRLVLDAVASGLREDGATRSARWLRERIGTETASVDEALERLAPRYVTRFDGVGSAEFQVTLAGLVQSPLRQETARTLQAALGEIARTYADNPDMREFRLDPVIASLGGGDKAFILAKNVLRASGWGGATRKNSDVWTLDAPEDAEQLKACATLDDYLRYLRGGQKLRPWPTCPRANTATFEARESQVGRSAPLVQPVSVPTGRVLQVSAHIGGGRSPKRKRWAEWEEIRKLGSGGQGTSYLVESNMRGEAALKVLRKPDEKKRARFAKEAKALGTLDHPGILEIVEQQLEHDPPFLVTRYCSGGNLQTAKAHEWPLPKKLALLCSIADAVAAAHGRGIVHRDLKPENILLKDDGISPVVADFGICFMMGDEDERRTSIDEPVGARHYIAPELETGRQTQVTPACDTYSLGKILYWLCSGGRNLPREQHKHPNLDLTNAGRSVEMNLVYDLLDRLVEQDPLQRVPNAGALVLELEKLMGKTKAKAHVLDRGVRQHCLYCAEGAYQVVFDHLAPKLAEEEMQRRRVLLGLGVASGGSLVLVCDNCGHVQLFRPEAAARGNAWR